MTTVNPVTTVTYFLTPTYNPITFGALTDVEVSFNAYFFAVYGGTGTFWQVTNSGKLLATSAQSTGVEFKSGGSLNNLTNASVAGVNNGVYVPGGSATVTNSGVISGTGATSTGVDLRGGGGVTNQKGGVISGGANAVYINGGAGTVINAATLTGSGASSTGVDLRAGGSITNQTGGSVSGGLNGVYVTGGAATLSNAGNITGAGGSSTGVNLTSGGVVTNQSGGTIHGGAFGVYVKGGSGTVTNGGVVSGATGVDLVAGGSVANETGGGVQGGLFGIYAKILKVGVTNAGDISGATAVDLKAGGSVNNQKGGVIIGAGDAVYVAAGAANVTNAGRIYTGKGGLNGVDLAAGGSLTNLKGGAISGARFGLYLSGGAAQVINAGRISGVVGAIRFAGSGANKLTLETGASLTGAVIGSKAKGATTALVLAGAGSTRASFDGVTSLSVGKGVAWRLSGTSNFGTTSVSGSVTFSGSVSTALTVSGGGSAVFTSNFIGATTFKGAARLGVAKAYSGKIAGFGARDTVDLIGIGTATHCRLGVNGALAVAGGSRSARLFFATPAAFSGDQFVLKSDGHGGTDVTLAKRISKSITFSEFKVGTAITSQYRSYGVQFLPDKTTVRGRTTTSFCTIYADNNDPTEPALVNSARGPGSYSGPIVGKFVDPNTGAAGTVTQFSLDAGFFDAAGSTIVEWFDAGHHLIGKQANAGIGYEHFTIHSATPIASFEVISRGKEINGFGIDNLLVGHVTG